MKGNSTLGYITGNTLFFRKVHSSTPLGFLNFQNSELSENKKIHRPTNMGHIYLNSASETEHNSSFLPFNALYLL